MTINKRNHNKQKYKQEIKSQEESDDTMKATEACLATDLDK